MKERGDADIEGRKKTFQGPSSLIVYKSGQICGREEALKQSPINKESWMTLLCCAARHLMRMMQKKLLLCTKQEQLLSFSFSTTV